MTQNELKEQTKRWKDFFFKWSPLGEIADLMEEVKSQFDGMMSRMKLIMVECSLSAERETLSGPDYLPVEGWQKLGYQKGSVYVSGEKVPAQKPWLRENGKERGLPIYKNLRDKKHFSEEIFQKTLTGISKSTVSRHVVTALASQLKELQERSLKDFDPFAIFIDGYHIAGEIYIIARR